ncbi:hypothetical protein DFA_12110 [Cavenderia fasciculata]|uniref:Methyltransferase small domain-containing protein n=1 Tax=Cavenderia fasciculata TaxID=261658 RepID=F4QFU3_CACFS|nr:uncharacterized protein DFA_12110 [Cavenderia fasciculata]EGG14340.1 hypothetical protein DFA_12110 [Cavenderia fasciculata]|eukprot:XP_004351049.1 hypothetical protein DFA_12110 [Cavenderia fasciculata]
MTTIPSFKDLVDEPLMDHLTSKDYKDVYEPAQDSYLFINALKKDLDDLKLLNPSFVIEIGSGSGFVISYLAKILENNGYFMSTDINPIAARVSSRTATHNNVSLDVINTSFLTGIERVKGKVDVLLFNPPYVPTESEEIEDGGIAASWAGGIDGREVIDKLLPQIDSILSPKGVFYMVLVEENHPKQVAAILANIGELHLSSVCTHTNARWIKFAPIKVFFSSTITVPSVRDGGFASHKCSTKKKKVQLHTHDEKKGRRRINEQCIVLSINNNKHNDPSSMMMNIKQQQEFFFGVVKSIPRFVGDQLDRLTLTDKLGIGSAAVGWTLYSASRSLHREEELQYSYDDLAEEFNQMLLKLSEACDNFEMEMVLQQHTKFSQYFSWLAGVMKDNSELCLKLDEVFETLYRTTILLFTCIFQDLYIMYQESPQDAKEIRSFYLLKGIESQLMNDLFSIMIYIMEIDDELGVKTLEDVSNFASSSGFDHHSFIFGRAIAKSVVRNPQRQYSQSCLEMMFTLLFPMVRDNASTVDIDLAVRIISRQVIKMGLTSDNVEGLSGFHISHIIPTSWYIHYEKVIYGALTTSFTWYMGWMTPIHGLSSIVFFDLLRGSYVFSKGQSRIGKFLKSMSPLVPFIPLYISTKSNWKSLVATMSVVCGSWLVQPYSNKRHERRYLNSFSHYYDIDITNVDSRLSINLASIQSVLENKLMNK